MVVTQTRWQIGTGLFSGAGPSPEPREELQILHWSQEPGHGTLRVWQGGRKAKAKGWSVPILTLAHRALGNFSVSCRNMQEK